MINSSKKNLEVVAVHNSYPYLKLIMMIFTQMMKLERKEAAYKKYMKGAIRQ